MQAAKRTLAYAAIACGGFGAFAVNVAATPEVGARGNGWSLAEERGLKTYVACWDEFKAQCGRNIVDDGLASGNPPSEARVKDWTATMDRWLHPPVAPEPVASSSSIDSVAPAPVTTSVPVASASTGDYAIPSYIVECESGGDYSAQNASGAYGAYQIMPGTSAAYGCDMSSPAGQDQCAAKIYAAEGASPWACG